MVLANIDAGSDRTSKGLRAFRENKKNKNIRFVKNMEPLDFLKVIKNSLCLIGNSSVGIRECSYLGIPVVNIGSRQNGRTRGTNVIDIDYSEDEIINSVNKHLNHGIYKSEYIYGNGSSGKMIIHFERN